ncbi:putative bifunctional diguanylate cyclase/phosphodiesterase [Deinococcus hopiensis]|uniref:Diguanylate cyclase (GGDEF) domain-containing protein n=1 Tax=Deinococcus hopiensis KR-140 TaxID=695939 RepID=A0A1W1UGX2_9DEIO|nr:EAL domain-containing protein [Deinococcus hopiensis]SMB80061.1 diguanylate cyclase (GGDEF) domain-containing protein [Deinococcus hopiensis KR-140]
MPEGEVGVTVGQPSGEGAPAQRLARTLTRLARAAEGGTAEAMYGPVCLETRQLLACSGVRLYVWREGDWAQVDQSGFLPDLPPGWSEALARAEVGRQPVPWPDGPADLSHVALPLHDGQAVQGVLLVWNVPPRNRALVSEELGDVLGVFLGTALRAAQLHGDLSDELRRVRALYDVSRALAGAGRREEVLQTVVERAVQAVGADRASLVAFDMTGHEVDAWHVAGPGAAQVQRVTFEELWEGLSGWVLREGRPALSPRGEPDSRESSAVQATRSETECGCVAVLPLHSGGVVVGTLTVINRPNQRDFSPADLALLQSLVDQAAVAIEQGRLQGQLVHLAWHDPLTGLLNRAHFEDELQAALAAAGTSETTGALLLVDLDGFKHVNDSHGHPAGDALLHEVGQRLRRTVREDDVLGRLGADEFAVLLPRLAGEADALRVADRVSAALRAPWSFGGQALHLTASIGVSVFPDDGLDAGTLLGRAGLAVDHAKQGGRNAIVRATARFGQEALRRTRLVTDLHAALRGGGLTLHYQPLLELETGAPWATEALLRWTHPVLGPVSPAEFVPLAEEGGLMLDLGAWVLRAACAQARRWLDAGEYRGRMSVNVSAVQLAHPGFVDGVETALRESGLPPEALMLELTETAALRDLDASRARMAQVRELGVWLALDDFGAGQANLHQLAHLPVDVLKVDRSFTAGLDAPRSTRPLLQAAVGMARGLQLCVVVEGIETAEQLEEIRALGCDAGQGYFLGRPQPAEA